MDKSSSVKTVDRLVKILDSFSRARPTWSLAELSVHLGLPKSTLHRFLVSLEYHGVLRRDPGDMRWRLGYRLYLWGSLAAESTDLHQIARPIMRDLVAAAQETAILTVYHERQVTCVEKVETSLPVRLTLDRGTHHHPHAGASSKVLMAYLPEEEIQAIICDQGLPKLCANTITEPGELIAELDKIRRQGYAQSLEETDLGAWGIATPIYDRNREVVAAIGVAGPSSRFTADVAQRDVALCCEAARRISTLLSTGLEPSDGD